MSDASEPSQVSAPDAAAELASLQSKAASARVLLARLLQEVVVAESRLRNSQAAQILATNEQLVLTAIRHQTEAEVSARMVAKLSHSAEFDALTQLPNRVLMQDRCAQALALAKRHGRRLALLFVDLNNFKQINDSLGHAVGDEALKTMAHRLVAGVRDTDTVSRHGGDEFVILLTEVTQAHDAGRIANALIESLAAPSRIGEQVMRLTASIGIAIYPDDGADLNTLLNCADVAMYTARRQGLGCVAFFDSQAAASPFAQTTVPEAAGPTTVQALQDPVSRHADAVVDQQRHHAELREANEKLVLAALSAQELQAAAERAHRQQAEFLALVTHELANPLAPIRLAAAMLGQIHSAEPLLPRAQSIIEDQVENMARLVSAMQEVSQAGKLAFNLKRQTVDLVPIVDAAVAACRPAMDARLQAFTIQLPDRPVLMKGEAARLEQVVSNLLDNASQYTPDQGQIGLALRVEGEAAELSVSDSGIGISALALPTIFEPFAPDIPAIGLRAVGLGIGLTLVRALVEAHGGTVFARSAGTGRGSQFIVSLPLSTQQ